MAQSFFNLLLAKIPETYGRWIEWANGQLSPVHGSILIDPTGASIQAGNPLAVKGQILRASVTFTRPATTTPYSVGDLIANNETAGNVVPVVVDLGVKEALIRGLDMSTADTAFPAGTTIRWHVFDAAPTYGVGDNGAAAMSVPGVGAIGCTGRQIGYIDVTVDTWLAAKAVGQGLPSSGTQDIHFVSPDGVSTSVWLVPEVRTAFTPASGAASFTAGLVGIAA